MLAMLTGILSCVDTTLDDPPMKSLPYNPDMVVSIADLKLKYYSQGEYIINGDSSLFAVVTGDDQSGNLYKSAIFQDSTGGITGFNSGSGLFVGDSVRIYLKGVTISAYHDLMQLQNFSMENNIVKIDAGIPLTPKTITIEEAGNLINQYQSTLVKLENVQFATSELGFTYADSANHKTENHMLVDDQGNMIPVRTSGYSDFANKLLPQGHGSIVAILGRYDSDPQLLLRNVDDVDLNGPRNASILEGFEAGFGDWQTVSVLGDQVWEIDSHGHPGNCAKVTGYEGGNHANEDWLISPAINLSDATSAVLKFQTAKNYTGDPLKLMISTDYEGDVANATWIEHSAAWSSGSWTWVDSGDIDLAEYFGNTIHIAYKFTCSDSGSATWEVDNIHILVN